MIPKGFKPGGADSASQPDDDATVFDSVPGGASDDDELNSTAVVGGLDELIKKLGSKAATEANLMTGAPGPSPRRPTNDPDRTMAVAHSRDVLEKLRAEADAAAAARIEGGIFQDKTALRPDLYPPEPSPAAPLPPAPLHLDFTNAQPKLALNPTPTPTSRLPRRPLALVLGAGAVAAVAVAAVVLVFGGKAEKPPAPSPLATPEVVKKGPTVTPIVAAAPEIPAVPTQEAGAPAPSTTGPFAITKEGSVVTLSVGIQGSAAGFGFFRVPRPPGILIKLPRATLSLPPGTHKPGEGFTTLKVQKQGRGTIVRLTHAPKKKVAAVIRGDLLEITLQP